MSDEPQLRPAGHAAPPPAPQADTFPMVRDLAVMVSRGVLVLDVDVLETAIQQGETALTLAPVLDPTLAIKASGELESQLKLLRGLLAFRRVLEEFRDA